MKTTIVPLQGDPLENLYQLGLKEREAFRRLEDRVTRLLSTNALLRQGQDIITRARLMLRKRPESFFDQCIKAYAEGLGVDSLRYMSFLTLFEIAAHYGQAYPELKSFLPGCTSVFKKDDEGITHSRLLDFPLIELFEQSPHLYLWQCEGKPTILSYSCQGLAPLFFQAVHESGVSFALHHKPGLDFNNSGQSIFEIIFEALFSMKGPGDFKKEMKRYTSMTKWGLLLLDQKGLVQVMDIDGPTLVQENYDLNETHQLIFTNIPLQQVTPGFEAYYRFSTDRQSWLNEKLKGANSRHILDLITDVEDQKNKKWLHPGATLSTVGAWHVNLSKGIVDVKEGDSALVQSDRILRFSLDQKDQAKVLKEARPLSKFENAWKRAAKAQGAFDQGHLDKAYHELQMALALMPNQTWKEILAFYQCLWDFKFVSNSRELALIYKHLKKLKVPENLKDQWLLLIMRFEKRLGLQLTVQGQDLLPALRPLFEKERAAAKPIFATWMKLLYPRLEILDVFSPHNR